MSDNIYYEITPKTPASAVVEEWRDSVKKHRAVTRAFEKKYKVKGDWVSWGNGSGSTVIGFTPSKKQTWEQFLASVGPNWRKVESSRGIPYVVPRKLGAAKPMAQEWAARPGILSIDHVKGRLTGCTDFTDWLEGHKYHNIGLRIRDNGSAIVVMPYFVTKCKKFQPIKGLKLAKNQNKLRDEWHKDK